MLRRIIVAAFVLPALAGAQAGKAPPSKAPAAAPAAAPGPPAEVYFRSPPNNSSMAGDFPVVFGLRNFGVAPAGANVTKTGHFHILVNTEPGPKGSVIPNDATHLHFGGGQIETTLKLEPGTYTLRLVLADFEHKVMGPEFTSQPLHVTVTAPSGGRK